MTDFFTAGFPGIHGGKLYFRKMLNPKIRKNIYQFSDMLCVCRVNVYTNRYFQSPLMQFLNVVHNCHKRRSAVYICTTFIMYFRRTIQGDLNGIQAVSFHFQNNIFPNERAVCNQYIIRPYILTCKLFHRFHHFQIH